MGGPYRLSHKWDDTSTDGDELRSSFPVLKLLITNDDTTNLLNLSIRLRDGSDISMNLLAQETFEEELKIEVVTLNTTGIAYRAWMWGTEGQEKISDESS